MEKKNSPNNTYNDNRLNKWENIANEYKVDKRSTKVYSLEMQADCNLVLYDVTEVCFLFYSLLNGKTPFRTVLFFFKQKISKNPVSNYKRKQFKMGFKKM